MKEKRLYRTIDTVASKRFSSESELLAEVVSQLVANKDIDITGGRIWELDSEKKVYKLLHQAGNVQKIKQNYALKISDYPIFDLIASHRTVLADETDKVLLQKGIFKYSASGVGSKYKIDKKMYYKYLLAVNSHEINDELRYTLNVVATVLTSKILERRAAASRKNLIADIDSAKQLQKSILPEHEYHFYNFDLFGVTDPAQIIGGDFFDYLKIGEDEQRLGIAVGDAASKGLSAAAEAMYISGAIRMASTFQIKISPFMNRMNELVNKIFDDDKFCSLFYGEISTDRKGLFLYGNAGHNPPMFYSKKKRKVFSLEPTGPLLGPAPHSLYETDSINFYPGDVLVIYSDGIVEAANNKFEFYEEKRLERVIRKHHEKTPKEIAHAILDDVYKFSTDHSKYQDDKTIVVIKRKDDNASRTKNI